MVYLHRLKLIIILIAVLVFILLRMSSQSTEPDVLLTPPGLRPLKDPSIIIPAEYQYSNQPLELPRYRDAFGKPFEGWFREFVRRRRFSSNRSAWIYYRISDLKQSKAINIPGPFKTIRIWPVGATIILESYQGNALLENDANLIAIEVMSKLNNHGLPATNSFYPVNWSYARFTAEGIPSLSSAKLNACHQCHSIAFRFTGDLVFTTFP